MGEDITAAGNIHCSAQEIFCLGRQVSLLMSMDNGTCHRCCCSPVELLNVPSTPLLAASSRSANSRPELWVSPPFTVGGSFLTSSTLQCQHQAST